MYGSENKGTSAGTFTDIDGNFEMNVPDLNVTLVVSFTGYSSQEVPLSGQNSVRITLQEGLSLDEVVVTGYSVDTRRSTPGSVSTVDSRVHPPAMLNSSCKAAYLVLRSSPMDSQARKAR